MIQARRRLMLASVGAVGGLVLPGKALSAQSNASGLMSAPKQALVIGNSKYRINPLDNPANDARAMGEILQGLNFQTVVGLDLPLVEMTNAIRAFADNLGRTKAVGLFYFAGHGAQLAWRNYALPVDAEIDTIDELRSRGVDINTVVDGMRRAGNPMNIVILDACRDNPTGDRVRPDQRGLSQIDAPPGTLLAYATAPGNTASDGTGTHGLYTEHLLREIKEPETKVEDVFKRVRLAVRKTSKGLQVPWESTSLEEDFWFVPPIRKTLADADVEREFEKELALWERAHKANSPEAIEEYLRLYPSGKFSELALFKLEQVLAARGEKPLQIGSSGQTGLGKNPFTKGTARANVTFMIGDSYTYQSKEHSGESREVIYKVTNVTSDEVIFNNGKHVTDLLGNIISSRRRKYEAPRQYFVGDYSLGKRWIAAISGFDPQTGKRHASQFEFKVVSKELVKVPAGEFECFKVEGLGKSLYNRILELTYWIAPDRIRKPIIYDFTNRTRSKVHESKRDELMSYHQSRA